MRRPLVLLGLAPVLMLLFGACAPARPMIAVVRGNLAHSRGDYQTALVHYLTADDEATAGWVLFNTANVYYALGEQEAALATWEESRTRTSAGTDEVFDGPEISLLHAASFNRGVLHYERGEFEAAYEEFRYALSLQPGSLATKRNLELALERRRAAESAPEEGGGTSGNGDGSADGDASTLRILEFVRRKEAERWLANREEAESGSARDW